MFSLKTMHFTYICIYIYIHYIYILYFYISGIHFLHDACIFLHALHISSYSALYVKGGTRSTNGRQSQAIEPIDPIEFIADMGCILEIVSGDESLNIQRLYQIFHVLKLGY